MKDETKSTVTIIEEVCEDICENYCEYRNTIDDYGKCTGRYLVHCSIGG